MHDISLITMIEAGLLAWKEEQNDLDISSDSSGDVHPDATSEIHENVVSDGSIQLSPSPQTQPSELILQGSGDESDSLFGSDSDSGSQSSAEDNVLSSIPTHTSETCLELVASVDTGDIAREKSIQMFLEGVLEYTFSLHRNKSDISEENIKWLLHITNQTLHHCNNKVSFTPNVYYDHITFNICKHYLSRILLTSEDTQDSDYGLSICPVKVKSQTLKILNDSL